MSRDAISSDLHQRGRVEGKIVNIEACV